jgi:hypothetical protein
MELQELEGRKVTLFGFSDFGFPVVRQTTIREVEQHDNGSKVLIHKPKRKRTWYRKTVDKRSELYVFDGWIDLEAEMYTETSPAGGKMSKACFDDAYMTEGLASAGIEPLMVINPRA